jgi:hypothetical protein
MSQCHDIYEPVPHRPAQPRTGVATRCHDAYEDVDLERADQEGHPEVDVLAGREPARV